MSLKKKIEGYGTRLTTHCMQLFTVLGDSLEAIKDVESRIGAHRHQLSVLNRKTSDLIFSETMNTTEQRRDQLLVITNEIGNSVEDIQTLFNPLFCVREEVADIKALSASIVQEFAVQPKEENQRKEPTTQHLLLPETSAEGEDEDGENSSVQESINQIAPPGNDVTVDKKRKAAKLVEKKTPSYSAIKKQKSKQLSEKKDVASSYVPPPGTLIGKTPKQQIAAFRDPTNKTYFGSLTGSERERLDCEAQSCRENPKKGTDDWRVLRHINMTTAADNLYLIIRVRDDDPKQLQTISLVQAEKYCKWADMVEDAEAMVRQGFWLCSTLMPYYDDSEKPIDQCRWRYEIHRLPLSQRKIRCPGMYYSFDNPNEKCDLFFDESDPLKTYRHAQFLCLLKEKSFVYGPFSFSHRTQWSVSKKVWHEALPVMLQKKTVTGVIFWHGFEDDVLVDAGAVDRATVEDAKSLYPKTEAGVQTPVLYGKLSHARQKEIGRFVPQSNRERRARHPALFLDVENQTKAILIGKSMIPDVTFKKSSPDAKKGDWKTAGDEDEHS